ncbi:MAG: IclR family transcriptional regulator C-terminal domain-containing protein, partial [Rubrivivax sp.]|nr:IclR family transcriptional regulator C-terminal domain-containing protein [Rubrivivax sp.]
EVARLNAIYSASFSVDAALLPVLRDLVAATQESAAFHVGRGEQRLCLLRVDSEQPLRDHVRAGDILPLARGAGGRVLLALGGAKGLPYVQIRRDAVAVLHGDRVAGLTGIAAPVWGPGAALAGAITLTLPDQRMQPHFEAAVRAAAARATVRLGGAGPPPEPAAD